MILIIYAIALTIFYASSPLLQCKKNTQEIEQGYQALRLTLHETEAPKPFYFYDYINIDDFSWQRGDDIIHLNIYASLLEEKCQINFVAHFFNALTSERYTSIELVSSASTDRFTSTNEISLQKIHDITDIENLTLVAECQIVDYLGRTVQLHMMKEITIKQPDLDFGSY